MKYPATVRRAMIITASVEVANKHGLAMVTRHTVATHAEISASTVRKYFPTLVSLLRACMDDARLSRTARRVGEGMGL